MDANKEEEMREDVHDKPFAEEGYALMAAAFEMFLQTPS